MPANYQRFSDNHTHAIRPQQIAVLHVEDSAIDTVLVSEKLKQNKLHAYSVDNAQSLAEAKERLQSQHYHIVFF